MNYFCDEVLMPETLRRFGFGISKLSAIKLDIFSII
ncbi:MAG: hypothetical protein UT11_C0019G0001, partial [Berkelbacteria bacterium GW2011_GWA2_38_9]